MTDNRHDWDKTTWEGSRREQLRQSLKLSIRERIAAIEDMQEVSDVLATARTEGRLVAGEQAQNPHSTGTAVVQDAPGQYQPNEKINRIVLSGCQPVPLASYLKALGVFRIVAEQEDCKIQSAWHDEKLLLLTKLDRPRLMDFFLTRYRPSPVLAPWNGGSGFYPKDNHSGISAIESAHSDRLTTYRDCIEQGRKALQHLGINERPEGDQKFRLLRALRNELPEEALAWLDAAVLLTEDNPKYPPLLGTGGNDGRLDFTNNFMQRLFDVIDPQSGEATPRAKCDLESALFGTPEPGMRSTAIGQFAPGNAGGVNASSGFEGDASVNPWDFVLMIEGALLFAATVTRRLESTATGTLSYPFTVRPVGSGSGSAALGDEGNARAEIWMPLWESPASFHELRSLLSEGKATLGRRPARDGLDFIRAVSRLGIDRGISQFQRYAFLMRSGKAYLATPLNRIEVQRNPAMDLISEIESRDQWLNRFRRLARSDHAANRVKSLVRRLEDAIFDLSLQRNDPAPASQRLLTVLGQAERYLAVSPAARETCPPVPWLGPQWFVQADDGSDEVAIAAALADLPARQHAGNDERPRLILPMRSHLAPVAANRRVRWQADDNHQVTWSEAPLQTNLLNTLQRRLLLAQQMDLPDKPFAFIRYASLDSVARWLSGELDESRIQDLFRGFCLVRLPPGGPSSSRELPVLPATYRMLKPFFCTDRQLHEAEIMPADGALPLAPELLRKLAANDAASALRIAQPRLRNAGIQVPFRDLAASRIDGSLLCAALMTPIAGFELKRLFPKTEQNQQKSA